MRKHSARRVALAAAILSRAGAALAAEPGPYVRVDLGKVAYPDSVAWQAQVLSPSVLSGDHVNTTDYAWSLSAGYRFDRYFGLEAGYVDLGRFSGKLTDHLNPLAGRGDFSFSARGETLAAVAAVPLGSLDLFLKAGVFLADSQLRAADTGNNAPLQTRESLHTNHGLFGLGLGYSIDSDWHAQLGWTRYLAVGDKGRINGPNIDCFTFGVSFHFGA